MPSKGIILSAFNGGSGKTAVTSLVLAGLSERGLVHQCFKTGPDYIDPGFHNTYSTETPYNLDLFMMTSDEILDLASKGKGIGVLEGMDGLFEGVKPDSDRGSTVELARMFNWPVVLIIDGTKANRSSYAAIKGYIEEAKPARVAGVIINKLRSAAHENYLRTAYESAGIKVFGAIHQNDELNWPERHLGLRPGLEFTLPPRASLSKIAEKQMELDALIQLADETSTLLKRNHSSIPKSPTKASKRLAIARDEAFHFYYRDSLEFLQNTGFELVSFSPLVEKSLPTNIDGLILGGGFPEVYAKQLSSNSALLENIRDSHQQGLPIYAECGGLMYLAERLVTQHEQFPMCGIVPGDVTFTKQLQHFGYSTVHHPLGGFKGHEFHYSKWNEESQLANLWTVEKAASGKQRKEGYCTPKLHASYIHLNFREASAIFESLFKNIDYRS